MFQCVKFLTMWSNFLSLAVAHVWRADSEIDRLTHKRLIFECAPKECVPKDDELAHIRDDTTLFTLLYKNGVFTIYKYIVL